MSPVQEIAGKSVLEWFEFGREKLLRAGIEEGPEECARILMKLTGCTRFELQRNAPELTAPEIRERFFEILEKRERRIPLAYLLQEAHFWQETLFVNEHCLIPRPETEILVEQVLKVLGEKAEKKFSFLDIGTGSGAIAIALLRACSEAEGTLLDVSGEALELARRNIEKYGLQHRAALVQGDVFNVSGEVLGKWDVIVSNPPYLSAADWKAVQEELKAEPRRALDGGVDGLDFYRRIVAEAKEHLSSGGMLALEVGQGQSGTVSTWLQAAGYDNIQRFRDYSGIERVVIANKGGILI